MMIRLIFGPFIHGRSARVSLHASIRVESTSPSAIVLSRRSLGLLQLINCHLSRPRSTASAAIAKMRFLLTPLLFFFCLLLLTLAPTLTLAQQQKPSIYIPPSKSGYTYLGCYNETTDLADTAGLRALNGGKSAAKPGEMTVDMCLEFCSTGAGDSKGGNTARFVYVGLEYSR